MMKDKHPVTKWFFVYLAFFAFVFASIIFDFDPVWLLAFWWYDKMVRDEMKKARERKS